MRLRLLIVVFSSFLILETVYSQIANQDSLDTFFIELENNEKFMGNVLILKNQKKLYSVSLGFSNLDAAKKANFNTKYRIGSISKTLTASLVLKAVEEGKINLSQSIESFFPTIKNADKINIAHLLNHHSGIHNFTSNEDFMQWHFTSKTEEEMVDVIASEESDFEPGEKAAYSNSNYVLLSYILQKVYNKKYADILQDKIITPLHLKHTRFGDRSLPENEKTNSYFFELKWNRVTETDESIPMGAGGIVMSAYDLSLFIDGLFNGKLLSKKYLDKMLTQIDGYGMGIFKVSINNKEAYTHDGKIDGFNSVFYYFPKEQITYVLLSNAENYSLSKINDILLKATFNQTTKIPRINPYKLSFEDLNPYLGIYTSQESPLIITISRNKNKLLAQPEGQKIFTMDSMDKDLFKHDKSGVTLEFVPSENKMTMKQGEQVLNFYKQ